MGVINWTSNWYTYPVNYSNNTGIDGIGRFIQYTSFILNDWFATGFILLIWLTVFGASLIVGSRKAIMVASFITGIFSIYFWRLGSLNPLIVVVLFALFILGVLGSKEPGGL